MKALITFISFCLTCTLLLTSCGSVSITKRQHSKGYHVDYNNNRQNKNISKSENLTNNRSTELSETQSKLSFSSRKEIKTQTNNTADKNNQDEKQSETKGNESFKRESSQITLNTKAKTRKNYKVDSLEENPAPYTSISTENSQNIIFISKEKENAQKVKPERNKLAVQITFYISLVLFLTAFILLASGTIELFWMVSTTVLIYALCFGSLITAVLTLIYLTKRSEKSTAGVFTGIFAAIIGGLDAFFIAVTLLIFFLYPY